MNALQQPATVVVFGGTSDIGLAIVRSLVSPALRHVVLACRDAERGEAAAASLRVDVGTDVDVHVVDYDAAVPERHAAVVDGIVDRIGDLDVVVFAAGILGRQEAFDEDPAGAARLVTVNHAGGVSTCLAVAARLRVQGHGRLVVLSSVAGERVRRANFVYGGSKAGLDGFAQGLGDALDGTGASVLVVRPGFVRSAMTEGLPAAPFATTPEAVGAAVAEALGGRRRTIWVPGVLRVVFAVFRHLPGPIWRRLPVN